ncbi:MAG TPA: phenylacetate--CoA ligase family protein [Deltaproteobacteria bacterium]|nr:phenylacetate--CoA ligase family protein [Deltaproteobacteria bacterium]
MSEESGGGVSPPGDHNELLRAAVRYAAAASPFYRERFARLGIDAAAFRGVEDLPGLPLTTRGDIERSNWDFLAAGRRAVREIVSTTGTTGEPLFFAMTAADIERLAENERRSFERMGLGEGDVVHLAVTMDSLFIAGLAYHSGLARLGAAAVRCGPKSPLRHLELLRSLRPAAVVAVPSFLVHMASEARRLGIAVEGLVPKALLIGETVRNEDFGSNRLGVLVEEAWGCETFSTYGITEAQTAFTECAEHRGFHAHPDFVHVEVVDDEGRVLGPGEPGELVLTTLGVEGMPLVRYRTGDMSFIVEGHCPCGNRALRIGPVIGRRGQKLKVKGTTVYPPALENALLRVSGVVNFQIEARSAADGSDRVLVRVGSERKDYAFADELRSTLRAVLRVTPDIVIMSPPEVEALLCLDGRRKKATFVDKREKKRPEGGTP